jgi:hypothetical protein
MRSGKFRLLLATSVLGLASLASTAAAAIHGKTPSIVDPTHPSIGLQCAHQMSAPSTTVRGMKNAKMDKVNDRHTIAVWQWTYINGHLQQGHGASHFGLPVVNWSTGRPMTSDQWYSHTNCWTMLNMKSFPAPPLCLQVRPPFKEAVAVDSNTNRPAACTTPYNDSNDRGLWASAVHRPQIKEERALRRSPPW